MMLDNGWIMDSVIVQKARVVEVGLLVDGGWVGWSQDGLVVQMVRISELDLREESCRVCRK